MDGNVHMKAAVASREELGLEHMVEFQCIGLRQYVGSCSCKRPNVEGVLSLPSYCAISSLCCLLTVLSLFLCEVGCVTTS